MSKPMGRPRMENANTIVKSVKLNKQLIDEVNQYAQKKGLSFGKVVRLALEEYLKK